MNADRPIAADPTGGAHPAQRRPRQIERRNRRGRRRGSGTERGRTHRERETRYTCTRTLSGTEWHVLRDSQACSDTLPPIHRTIHPSINHINQATSLLLPAFLTSAFLSLAAFCKGMSPALLSLASRTTSKGDGRCHHRNLRGRTPTMSGPVTGSKAGRAGGREGGREVGGWMGGTVGGEDGGKEGGWERGWEGGRERGGSGEWQRQRASGGGGGAVIFSQGAAYQ